SGSDGGGSSLAGSIRGASPGSATMSACSLSAWRSEPQPARSIEVSARPIEIRTVGMVAALRTNVGAVLCAKPAVEPREIVELPEEGGILRVQEPLEVVAVSDRRARRRITDDRGPSRRRLASAAVDLTHVSAIAAKVPTVI